MNGEGHEANRQQHGGVEQDVHLGVVHAMGHRQHRHVDLGVLVLAVDRQGPEVRRRPGEDDQHQQQRLGGDLAGYRDPAEQGRRGAGQAADDDVLRCGALEKAGIDHRVTDQRGQRQPGGEGVGEGQQQGQPADAEDEGEGQCRRRRDPAFGQWPLVSAGHHRIDLPVHHMVHRRRAAGAQGDAEVAEQQHRPGHTGAGGEEHAHQRGDEHQQHHLRLGQLQVVAPAGLGAVFAE